MSDSPFAAMENIVRKVLDAKIEETIRWQSGAQTLQDVAARMREVERLDRLHRARIEWQKKITREIWVIKQLQKTPEWEALAVMSALLPDKDLPDVDFLFDADEHEVVATYAIFDGAEPDHKDPQYDHSKTNPLEN